MKSKAKPDQELAAAAGPGSEAAVRAAPTSVAWDDTGMRSHYANVINVINTREEFSLFFGQNQTWDVTLGHGVRVKLESRVVMSPYAAKRLYMLLGEKLASYEQRFGPLDVAG